MKHYKKTYEIKNMAKDKMENKYGGAVGRKIQRDTVIPVIALAFDGCDLLRDLSPRSPESLLGAV